jgi:hypothetical protein
MPDDESPENEDEGDAGSSPEDDDDPVDHD